MIVLGTTEFSGSALVQIVITGIIFEERNRFPYPVMQGSMSNPEPQTNQIYQAP